MDLVGEDGDSGEEYRRGSFGLGGEKYSHRLEYLAGVDLIEKLSEEETLFRVKESVVELLRR